MFVVQLAFVQLAFVNLYVHTYADGTAAGHNQSHLGWRHTNGYDQSHRSVNLKGYATEATLKQSGLFCIQSAL
jgi:hypothetical protein